MLRLFKAWTGLFSTAADLPAAWNSDHEDRTGKTEPETFTRWRDPWSGVGTQLVPLGDIVGFSCLFPFSARSGFLLPLLGSGE